MAEKFFKFLGGHLLSTMIWWLPILVIVRGSTLAVIIFLSFYISYTYWQWRKYLNPKKLKIYRASNLIEIGYYASTGLFLFLTGKYVYDGLMSNYVVHPASEGLYVFLYAVAITLTLATITYMIKTGRQWPMLCVVYLLFDLPGAMPFNFLHFYENQKTQNRLDIDKELVREIELKSESIVRLRLEKAKSSLAFFDQRRSEQIRQIGQQQQLDATAALLQIQRQAAALQNILDTVRRNNEAARMARQQTASPSTYIQSSATTDSIALNRTDSGRMANYLVTIQSAGAEIEKLNNTKSREAQLVLVEGIKSKLQSVCTGVGDSTLLAEANKLLPNEPTQLESLEAVYDYIAETIFSAGNAHTDERTRKLVLMSLIPSIIIDILPLLFSIIYAKWCRPDED